MTKFCLHFNSRKFTIMSKYSKFLFNNKSIYFLVVLFDEMSRYKIHNDNKRKLRSKFLKKKIFSFVMLNLKEMVIIVKCVRYGFYKRPKRFWRLSKGHKIIATSTNLYYRFKRNSIGTVSLCVLKNASWCYINYLKLHWHVWL